MYVPYKPVINLIAAVAIDGSIGGDGELLWKISKDLQYFKAKTWNNIVIIGYETYKTLPKIAFNGRKFVVVIKTSEYSNKLKENTPFGTRFAFSVKDAIIIASQEADYNKRDIFIAGGASIYKQMMEYCNYAHITWVNGIFKEKADKFFPISDFFTKFELISESIWHDNNVKKRPSYQFATYKKRR